MSLKRFITLFGCALLGGFCVAFAFAVSIDGRLDLHTLTLPSVIPVTMIGGVAGGILISPVMIWAFRDKCLRVVIPTTYVFAIFITIMLNVIQVRYSAFISFGIIIGTICIYRILSKTSGAGSVRSNDTE